jgi:hypothetical protein
MRNSSFTVLQGADTGNLTGDAIDSGQWINATFQYYFGDLTAAGDIIIEGSCDPVPEGTLIPFTPANWDVIANGTISVTGGSSGVLQVAPICYRFIRVRYERTSGGSTTITVNVDVQGI